MGTIQVVLDSGLLRAIDRVAPRTRVKRSRVALEALREHLKRPAIRELEARDRQGFQRDPQCLSRVRELGASGGVAAAITRGDVHLYRFPSPNRRMPVVVLTRAKPDSILIWRHGRRGSLIRPWDLIKSPRERARRDRRPMHYQLASRGAGHEGPSGLPRNRARDGTLQEHL